MNAALLQAKIYAGYAKAASIVGPSFVLYRPGHIFGATPVSLANQVATVNAQFTVNGSGMNYGKPGGDEDLFWQALADGSQTQIGDYLVNATAGTFFITAMQPLLPILAVKCNAMVSIRRPDANASDTVGAVVVGAQSYQGVEQSTAANNPNAETVLFNQVPAALVARAVGKARGLDIVPSDAPGPGQWWVYLSPSACPQGSIRDRDVVMDAYGYRHQVASAYWSMNGYLLRTIRVEA